MSAQLLAPLDPPPSRGNGVTPVPDDEPVTRVLLIHVPQQLVLSLRFGRPARQVDLDELRGVATFLPGARFARTRWEAGDAGLTCRQLLVLQACKLHEPMQHIKGVRPGACVLLRAEGQLNIDAALHRIAAIEALGIDPADVDPRYWRQLSAELAVGRPLPVYTLAQYATWQLGKQPS